MARARKILEAIGAPHPRFWWNSDDNIRVIPAHVVSKLRRKKFTEAFTQRQLRAITSYTGAGSNFRAINGQLRGAGYADLSVVNPISWLQSDRMSLKNTIDDLDSVVNNSTLDKNMTLYRGIPFNIASHMIFGLHPGDHLQDGGYMSISKNEGHAAYFSRNGSALMVIHAKRGATAFEVPQDLAGATWTGQGEDEVIFPRDTVLEFTGKKGEEYNFDVVA